MRVLLLTETPPWPLDSGGRIKTFHTLGMLSATHEVHCHALTRDRRAGVAPPIDARAASVTFHVLRAGAVAEARSAGRALWRGLPLTVARHFNREVATRIVDSARRRPPDLVYCDHLSMMEYARLVDRPILYDAHNVEFLLVKRVAAHLPWSARRLGAEREWRALRSYERRACLDAAGILTVSEVDADRARALTGVDVAVRVVPIAIDVTSTPPVASLTRAARLLFVGGLHWPPNADAVTFFARQVLPIVRREVPGVELAIAGRDDAPAARWLAREAGIRLTGRVDDVGPLYESSRVVVVPVRSGSGTRVKILEAFARGVPVVSTPIGHEGIEVTPGAELLSAADPEGFAAHVVTLLRDDARAAAVAAAARRFVAAHHDVPVVAARLAAAMSMLG
jgi:glycosyltransferase involved in cell wall biosynthesis